MEGHLAHLLDLLLVTAPEDLLVHPLGQEALSDQLIVPTAELDVKQSVVIIPDLAVTEAAESELDQGPVVHDLSDEVAVVHRVLEVGHEHQVPGRVPPVVDGVVIDLTEDHPGPQHQPVRDVLTCKELCPDLFLSEI